MLDHSLWFKNASRIVLLYKLLTVTAQNRGLAFDMSTSLVLIRINLGSFIVSADSLRTSLYATYYFPFAASLFLTFDILVILCLSVGLLASDYLELSGIPGPGCLLLFLS